ncbi:MAG: FAD binding domain-containing protein [Alphaproteobacteria bacterium]|jgi:CO/xanthine dehydrogenase FAD-binding subunit|nr:FAD binding domain-containing protein [Alphaproteobacteria bacterium]MDP6567913.1 FAD binding domain-containing protein [Alphaproteobacteria bacterium]
MKAAPFDYVQPTELDEVCRHLAAAGDDARIIAGGQSLVPMMAMRLARPELLVDINRVAALQGAAVEGRDLVIGAGSRQRWAETSELVFENCPLLIKALRHVGHLQTRNRGTMGGSLAHADPAAEIPLAAVTLAGRMRLVTASSERRLAADDFFDAAMITALGEDECLADLSLPIWQEPTIGTAFTEISMRRGDFALVAAAAQLALDEAGICRRAAVGIGGVASRPLRLDDLAARLLGTRLDRDAVVEAAASIVGVIDPQDDVHATAAYRRRVAPRLLTRTILEAADEARAKLDGGPA